MKKRMYNAVLTCQDNSQANRIADELHNLLTLLGIESVVNVKNETIKISFEHKHNIKNGVELAVELIRDYFFTNPAQIKFNWE